MSWPGVETEELGLGEKFQSSCERENWRIKGGVDGIFRSGEMDDGFVILRRSLRNSRNFLIVGLFVKSETILTLGLWVPQIYLG